MTGDRFPAKAVTIFYASTPRPAHIRPSCPNFKSVRRLNMEDYHTLTPTSYRDVEYFVFLAFPVGEQVTNAK
jgi:hypothetical protein